MTVLAGLWPFPGSTDQSDADQAVAAMLDAQMGFPATAHDVRVADPVTFGQKSASARFDRETVAPPAGSAMVVADARIDNRAEVFDKLSRRDDPSLDDAGVIGLAYRQWGEQLVDHVLGDFAIAGWDPAQQTIVLIRDPTGQRPLHYHRDGRRVAFASLPQGLFALGIPKVVDRARLANFVVNAPADGPQTFFEGIMRVEPAQIVRIDRRAIRARCYWRMPTREIRYRKDDDYIDAFREQLDRATRVRMRDSGPVVAAHLSAGLDSGAVAATAARQCTNGARVLAITSAPRSGFAGPVPQGRIADESAMAAAVAARYPNMDHLVLRTSGASPLDYLDDDARLFAQPVGHPCNNVWWRDLNAAARAHGATVMLTGEMGNLSLSAGNFGVLADLVRDLRGLTWLREVVAVRKSGPSWRRLLALSFAPFMPERLWTLATKLSSAAKRMRRNDCRSPRRPSARLSFASASANFAGTSCGRPIPGPSAKAPC